MRPKPAVIQVASLVGVLLLGLYLRGITVQETRIDNPLRADAGDYIAYALNMTEHGTYSRSRSVFRKDSTTPKPDAVRAPGYPTLIAAVLTVMPDPMERTAILWLQVALSVLTIFMCWLLFHEVLSAGAAWTAALLTALSPHLVMMNVYYLTETLYAFLLVTTMWLAGKVSPRPMGALATGVGFGLNSLTRPGIQYFTFLYAVFLGWSQRRNRGPLLAVLLLGGFLIVAAPWMVRNVSTIGSISDKTLMINFIAHGMYPGFLYKKQAHTYALPYRYDPKRRSYSRSVGALLKELRDRATQEPVKYMLWYLQKPFWLWRWESVQGAGDIYIYPTYRSPYEQRALFQLSRSLMKSLHIPLVLLAFAGCIFVWLPYSSRTYNPRQLFILRGISGLLFYYTLIHMIGAPFPRYSIPMRPFVYGMALVTIQPLMRRLWSWRSRTQNN